MKTILSLCTGAVLLLFASCLRKDLPELPLYGGNSINNVYVEYRYADTSNHYNDEPIIAYLKLSTTQTIDSSTHTVKAALTVPAASGSFTTAQRDKVSLDKLWPYFDISTAATIRPLDGTPNPGDSTDCTKPLNYEVTAANGKSQKWTLIITGLQK